MRRWGGFLFILFLSSLAHAADILNPGELETTLRAARNNALAKQGPDGSWDLPSVLGSHYLSQYYLLQKWLGRSEETLDASRLKGILLSTQLKDGSWFSVKNASSATGELSPTILNYAALKGMGVSVDDPALSRARHYIVRSGGIESATMITKCLLALFGNFAWKQIPPIPFFLFSEVSPVRIGDFAHWIGPHVTPLAYLRWLEISKDLGPDFALRELSVSGTSITGLSPAELKARAGSKRLKALVDQILEKQRPHGSWGGYVQASLLSIVALQDYANRFPAYLPETSVRISRAVPFIERLFLDSGDSSYRGAVSDGRYWDTALMAGALLESGHPAGDSKKTGDFLIRSQTPSGGFYFGYDFENAPDTDDTAEVILALKQIGGFDAEVAKAIRWVQAMQNADGGWSAFSKNSVHVPLLDLFLKPFSDSASLYDDSCADITGHILEALGAHGFTATNSATVRRAVTYLSESQDRETGAWRGRWGVNYLYGTGAAIVGMVKTGTAPSSPTVQKALRWLREKQNTDGGYGESTASDRDKRLAGIGPSTPTQTAWVLLALVESGEAKSERAMRAARYLVKQFSLHGKWIDPSVVGTGHPGVVYMEYPAYPYAFPLMALARFARAF